MKVDWDSPESEVLLNPRLPLEEAKKWQRELGQLDSQAGFQSSLSEGHFWLATSGSSGKSKWVALSKRAILASAQAVNRHLESEGRDRWLHVLPSFHVGGLGIWARSHLSGAQVLDLGSQWKKWDPWVFAHAAEESKATLSALVPTQIFDLVQARVPAPHSLRAIVVGGGALSDSLYWHARKLGWNILPSYGLTECASQVATARLDSLKSDLPGDGCDLSVLGDSSFQAPPLKLLSHVEVRSSSEGRIELKSEALLTGYALETATGVEWVEPKIQGWFTTEDLGTLDGEYLQVSGRQGSFLKIGGESVDFSRLEMTFEEIRMQLGIDSKVALIAVPDERLGFVTHLVSERAPEREAHLSVLVDRFNQSVLPIFKIRKSHFLESLPRSPLGKLLREEIIQLIK